MNAAAVPAHEATGLFHPRPRSQVIRDLVNRSRRHMQDLPDPALDAHFPYGLLLWDGSMHAACFGTGCPADPTDVIIEADRNLAFPLDRIEDPNGIERILSRIERRDRAANSPHAPRGPPGVGWGPSV